MTQQLILLGTSANDGTGDTIRVAFDKVNDNFTELYNATNNGDGPIVSIGAVAPLSTTGGINPQLSIQPATASQDGYLTSTDWARFDNIVSDAITSVTTIGSPVYGLSIVGGASNGVANVSLSGTLTVPVANITAGGNRNSSTYLRGDGVWTTVDVQGAFGGTVTQVEGTGTVNGLTLTGFITGSGQLTLGGTLSVPVANISATGTASSSTFLRGDGAWGTIPDAQIQSDWTQTNTLSKDYIKNKPTIVTPVNADWNATSGLAQILNKPTFSASELTSGSYTLSLNLDGTITLPAGGSIINTDTNIVNITSNAYTNNKITIQSIVGNEQIALQVNNKNWTFGPTGTLTIPTGGSISNGSSTVAFLSDLPTVTGQVQVDWNSTSGLSQILNKPTIPSAQVNSDWNATSGLSQILNKPTITTPVNADWTSTSGLSQILNKPTIPAAQVNSDWNSISGLSQILNKPTIPAAQVQSDWTATTGLGVILNKPTLFDGQYSSLAGKPSLFDGQYSSLAGKPDLTVATLTSGTITNVPNNTTDIVNKAYVDSVANGVNYHPSVDYASTASTGAVSYYNGSANDGIGATLTGAVNSGLDVDGYTVDALDVLHGHRFLIKNETNSVWNGVYICTVAPSPSAGWVLTRATDYDKQGNGVNEIDAGDFIYVLSGSTNSNTSWIQQAKNPVIGTNAITFVQFAAAGTVYSAGTGLSLSPNNQFSITDTAVTAGTYGSSSTQKQYPVVTVNSKGQITSASSVNLATVATSGSYTDLSNTPTIPAAQVQSDWAATAGITQILNKPTIPDAQVKSDWNSASGLSEILNKPTIPAAQVKSDWNSTTGLSEILNKPTIPDAQIQSDWTQATTTAKDYIKNKPTLATVATSGSYNDLSNKLTAGTGISIDANNAINLSDTTVTAASYGTASQVAQITVNAQGRITSATNVTITIPVASITGNIAIAKGGTGGSATPTLGGIAYGTGVAYAFTTAGSANQVLKSNGVAAPTWGSVAYSELSGLPTIPAAQIQSDWTQATTTALDYIKNKPTLATVATSGSYNDLSSKLAASTGISIDSSNNISISSVSVAKGGTGGIATPTAGAVAIGNGTAYAFTDAGTSGQVLQSNGASAPTWGSVAYADISGTPTIPAAQIQSDWNQTTSTALDYIKNKPTVPSLINDLSDVTITTPTAGQFLKYDTVTSQWVNSSTISLALGGLSNVVLTSPTSGQVLKYNGTSWVNDVDNAGSGGTVNVGWADIQSKPSWTTTFDGSYTSLTNKPMTSVFEYMTSQQITDVQAGTASVDVSAAIQAALNASNNVFFPPGTYAISTGLTVPNANTVITGQKAIIKRTAAVKILSVSVAGVTVNGMTFDWNSVSGNSDTTPLVRVDAVDATFDSCTFIQSSTYSAEQAFRTAAGGNRCTVRQSKITGRVVCSNTDGFVFDNNKLFGVIDVQSLSSSYSANDARITNNYIEALSGGGSGSYLITVLSRNTNSPRPKDLLISNNTMIMGYLHNFAVSIDTVESATFSNNTVRSTADVAISYAVEVVKSQNVVCSDNVIDLTSISSTVTQGFSINNSRNCAISNNTVTVSSSILSGSVVSTGISVFANNAGELCDNNIISDNTFNVSDVAIGISIYTNATSSASRNVIRDNILRIITSSTTSSLATTASSIYSRGINIDTSGTNATTDSTSIIGNTIYSFNYAIRTYNTTNLAVTENKTVSVTTPINITGTYTGLLIRDNSWQKYSITDFGVKGDFTDETTVIQNAINSIKSSYTSTASVGSDGAGIELFFPRGRYLVSSIDIPSYFTIRGEGRGTLIRSTTATPIRLRPSEIDGTLIPVDSLIKNYVYKIKELGDTTTSVWNTFAGGTGTWETVNGGNGNPAVGDTFIMTVTPTTGNGTANVVRLWTAVYSVVIKDLAIEAPVGYWAVTHDSGWNLLESRFENIYIDSQYGLKLNRYTQSCVIDGLLTKQTGKSVEQMLWLRGNRNLITNLDKDDTGSPDPTTTNPTVLIEGYTITGKTFSERAQGNILSNWVMEGKCGSGTKPLLKLSSCQDITLSGIWIEPTGVGAGIYSGDVIVIDASRTVEFKGYCNAISADRRITVTNKSSVLFDELSIYNHNTGFATVDTSVVLDSTSDATIKTLMVPDGRNIYSPDSLANLHVNEVMYTNQDYSSGATSTLAENTLKKYTAFNYAGSNKLVNPGFTAGMYGWSTSESTTNYTTTVADSTFSFGKMLSVTWSQAASDSYPTTGRTLFQPFTITTGMVGKPFTFTAMVQITGAQSTGEVTLAPYIEGGPVGNYLNAIYGIQRHKIKVNLTTEALGTASLPTKWYILTQTFVPQYAGAYNVGIKTFAINSFNITGCSFNSGTVGEPNKTSVASMDLGGKPMVMDTGIPTTGTWEVGSRVYNSNPSVGGARSWVCTSAADSTTGTIVLTAATTLTVASGTGINNGDSITIVGAGASNANLTTTVSAGGGTTSLTLATAASTAVTNAVVTTPGTWEPEGVGFVNGVYAGNSATVDVNSKKIVNLSTPTVNSDAATKGYVDGVASGLDVKASVKVATTGAITLSGTQTIDGIALVANDRVLVKDQADATLNGIWLVKGGGAPAWLRATDADATGEVTSGMFTFVEQGTVNAGTGWVLTTSSTITISATSPFAASTALNFSKFSSAGAYTLPAATTSALGGVIIPAVATSGITNSSGTIGLAVATSSQLGGVKIGTGISVDANGVISTTSAVTDVSAYVTGNGIADDTTGFNTALTAAAAASKRLFVGPTKIVNIVSDITIPDGVEIYGGGKIRGWTSNNYSIRRQLNLGDSSKVVGMNLSGIRLRVNYDKHNWKILDNTFSLELPDDILVARNGFESSHAIYISNLNSSDVPQPSVPTRGVIKGNRNTSKWGRGFIYIWGTDDTLITENEWDLKQTLTDAIFTDNSGAVGTPTTTAGKYAGLTLRTSTPLNPVNQYAIYNSDGEYVGVTVSKSWSAGLAVAVNDTFYVLDTTANLLAGTANRKYYRVTAAGNLGTSFPTHTSGTADNGTATLLYDGECNGTAPYTYKLNLNDAGSGVYGAMNEIYAGNLKIGKQYRIRDLANADQAKWNQIAGTTGLTYEVGSVFTAATTGYGSIKVVRALESATATTVTVNPRVWNIAMHNGNRNTISNNKLAGGHVGILMMPNTDATTYDFGTTDNKITGNKISFISEEGISIDCLGNGITGAAFLTTTIASTVSAINTNIVTLSHTTGAANAAKGKVLKFHDTSNEAMRGKSFKILSSNGTSVTLGDDFGGSNSSDINAIAGETVSIETDLRRNKISENTLDGTIISIWGSGDSTTISHNTINRSNWNGDGSCISIMGITAQAPLSGSIGTSAYVVPCNIVVDGNITNHKQHVNVGYYSPGVYNKPLQNIIITNNVGGLCYLAYCENVIRNNNTFSDYSTSNWTTVKFAPDQNERTKVVSSSDALTLSSHYTGTVLYVGSADATWTLPVFGLATSGSVYRIYNGSSFNVSLVSGDTTNQKFISPSNIGGTTVSTATAFTLDTANIPKCVIPRNGYLEIISVYNPTGTGTAQFWLIRNNVGCLPYIPLA